MVPSRCPRAWRDIGHLEALYEPPESEKALIKHYKQIACWLTRPRTNHECFLLEIRAFVFR